MQITDTHAHLYMIDFEEDLNKVIERAKKNGVHRILLPNVDEQSFDPMIKLCRQNPEIFKPMIGLHPCYVKKDYEDQVLKLLNRKNEYGFIAVGEIGIDLYWDTSLKDEQIKAFEYQTLWAIENKLPIVIHSRESLNLIIELLTIWNFEGLKGIFHCFTGNVEQAIKIIDLGFKLGIGGVVTYKKTLLDLVIKEIGTKDLVLETDSPYLSPVPFRGKRNESSYLVEILNKISFISGKSPEQIARESEESCLEIFGI